MTALVGYSVPETITDDAGNVLKSLTVQVTGPAAYTGTAVTGVGDGVLRLGPLPVGDYTVTNPLSGRAVVIPVVAAAADVQSAFDKAAAAIPLAQKGAVNGVASLDGAGTVPDAQIPATIARDAEVSTAVSAAVAALVASAPGALDTLAEIDAQLAADESAAAALTTEVSKRWVIVSHGSTAGTARPTSVLPVMWQGTVAPTNAVTRDRWYDESTELEKRYNGTSWQVVGSGTYAPLQVLSGATVDAARTAFLGDSITTLNGTGDVATFENTIDNYSGHIPVLSAGRVLYGRSFGAAGYTLEQIRDTVLPRLLAAPVLPGTVVLLGGTNNVGLGVSFVLSSAMTAVENIRATLAALGIRLVVCTIPPRADNTTANNNVTVLNAAISAYARKKGLNLLDFYGALVNPATGLFAAGMSHTDLIHPSPAGMLAMANAAIAGGFHLRNPAWKPDLVRSAIDTASFITPATRALFQIDTNADGIADGLTAFGGTKTASLVAASGGDIVGQWQRISRTTTDTGGTSYLQFNTVLGSFAVAGDRLSLACRLKVTGATGAYTYTTTPVGVRISLDLKDAGNVDQDVVRYQTSQDIDGTVYLERTVRSDTGKLGITFGADVPSVGTVVAQIAQVTVRNLTALGYV